MRTVDTNIAYNWKNAQVFYRVLSQMSDGIWKDCSRLTGYTSCIEIVQTKRNTIGLAPSSKPRVSNPGYAYKNPYREMSDGQILKFFRDKIRRIVKEEEKDKGDSYEWKKENPSVCEYLMGYKSPENVTVKDAWDMCAVLLKEMKKTA